MFSLIGHGNLNIKRNRKREEISLSGLRENHMIWNYSSHKKDYSLKDCCSIDDTFSIKQQSCKNLIHI